MKSLFDVMKKDSLCNYFIQEMVPQLRKIELKNDTKLREKLGLVLLSYLMSMLNGQRYVPAINNCDVDDGAVANIDTGEFNPVEQTYIYEGKWDDDVLNGIKDAINRKNSKGSEYSKNLWLVIYCNASGELSLDKIKDDVQQTGFTSVLMFGPSGLSEFSYNLVVAKDGTTIPGEIYNLTIDEQGKPVFSNL